MTKKQTDQTSDRWRERRAELAAERVYLETKLQAIRLLESLAAKQEAKTVQLMEKK